MSKTLSQYFSSDYDPELDKPRVCALCDAGFPIKRTVSFEVKQIDGVDVESPTYLQMSAEIAQKLKTILDQYATRPIIRTADR